MMNSLRYIISACILIFYVNISIAQEEIFPDLNGAELIENLRATFKPTSVLTSSEAKDTLYTFINNDNDTVRCVYSGHYQVLPENVDPSQWIFMNGETEGINLEHVYPQSKGATNGTPANSDLHHLFPTRVKVNSDRGSFPFGEIPDASTQRWYFMTSVTSSIPSSNIDLYSEWNNAYFEPREDFKGDVARAVFYFYTMYENQALAADPDFFELQRSTLLEWHELDPPNEAEVLRSERVAMFQDGKINPFVADPTLATRAFCMIGEECMTVGVNEFYVEVQGVHAFIADGTIKIKVRQPLFEEVDVEVYDLMGRIIYSSQVELLGIGLYELNFDDTQHAFRLLRIFGNNWRWNALLKN